MPREPETIYEDSAFQKTLDGDIYVVDNTFLYEVKPGLCVPVNETVRVEGGVADCTGFPEQYVSDVLRPMLEARGYDVVPPGGSVEAAQDDAENDTEPQTERIESPIERTKQWLARWLP